MSMSTCTSRDADNGCRALFNHKAGWAYFGPTGEIDPNNHPGTVSYSYNPHGGAGRQSSTSHNSNASTNQSKPGESVSKKTNEVLSAYLEGTDLSRLLAEVEQSRARDAAYGEYGMDYTAHDTVSRDPHSRRGLPIVLTLQAILSGEPSAAGAKPTRCSDLGMSFTANESACLAANRGGDGEPPRVSDHAHFPPLRSPDLFLAPPIVVKPEAGGVSGGVSCEEAVAEAAAAVATSEEASGVAGDAGGAGARDRVSRVGWWLRWAITGNSLDSEPSPNAADASAAVAIADASCEVRGGMEGWQVVSVGADSAAPAAGNDIDGASSWCDVDASDMVTSADADLSSYTVCNVPPRGTFRDMLMAPGAAAGAELSSEDASISSRPRAAATSVVPRVMDGTYLWKSAAAGKVGSKGGDDESVDEDPYYARKRIGAFAHRTKPRGKGHK